MSCNKENNPVKQFEGYIVGYSPCSVEVDDVNGNSARGFYLVSTDLKDTLLTFNFPENIISEIPSSYIVDSHYCDHFPESARYEFKIKIEYQNATVEEQQETGCVLDTLHLWEFVFCEEYTAQIIIKSAKRLN
jgi:hypothetical protein